MLFGVEGADRTQLRLVLAHEMIHALQGQHLPLDSILNAHENNDRLAAAQAILEGQATLASLDVLAPGQGVAQNPQFWELYREQVRQQQSSMPVFRRAPLVVREALIFPYLQGAEFMHWWGTEGHDDAAVRPADAGLHRADPPSRPLRAGRRAGLLAFAPDSGVVYEDVLGESEIRVLLAALAGSDEVQTVVPIGWGGDRFRLYRRRSGAALVWYVGVGRRSARRSGSCEAPAGLKRTVRPGYRAVLESVSDRRAAGRRGTCWRRRGGRGGGVCRR